MTLNILSIYKKITADYKSPQLPPPAPNPVLSKKLSELIPQVIEKYKNLPHWGKRIDNGRIKLQPLNNYEADVMLNANSESDLASLPVFCPSYPSLYRSCYYPGSGRVPGFSFCFSCFFIQSPRNFFLAWKSSVMRVNVEPEPGEEAFVFYLKHNIGKNKFEIIVDGQAVLHNLYQQGITHEKISENNEHTRVFTKAALTEIKIYCLRNLFRIF